MPRFDTLEPISVTLDLGAGDVRITASDRSDTVVEVHASNAADESDVHAAQQVRVDYAQGVLRVIGPKAHLFDFSRKTRSVQVCIELPTGSQLSAETQVGDLRGAGSLGACRFKTGAGNARLERTGPLRLHTGAGHVTVDGVAGDVEITTGTGKIQVGEVEGAAAVKSSNGDIAIDGVAGDARMRTANGEISLQRAGAGVDAKTSNGAIRVGEVVRGAVVLGTGAGDLDIGVAEGTAAWLDVNTGFGHLRNLLQDATRPGDGDHTVEVRGRTSFGDITIHRS